MEDKSLAICVRSAEKSYGRLRVLRKLNMDVPHGSIYGLLGSSGCGKTTLLRCILGRLSLAAGSVEVLGQPPGSKGHHVPGRDVGYMPQELALYGDFTMLETMYYFGILHGMQRTAVRDRGKFLLELLELPSQKKLIKKLSGGQKRRVSFAVAMLQEPPLLILDEPTVGVDPLLRAKIWQHMVNLVSTQGTTIVITTHYIEEARQANVVGLMRDGRLLAEAPPHSLISSYHLSTLEDVFLHLCRRQEIGSIQGGRLSHLRPSADESTPLLHSTQSLGDLEEEGEEEEEVKEGRGSSFCSELAKNVKAALPVCNCSCRVQECNPAGALPRPMNVLALCWKNFNKIYRNLGLLFFQFIIPTVQVVLFCLAVGRDLTGLRVTYCNLDQGNFGLCSAQAPDMNITLGHLYVSQLLNDSALTMMPFDSIEAAIAEVEAGRAWTAVGIKENFTEASCDRLLEWYSNEPIPNSTLDQSTIHLYGDVSNAQIAGIIENRTLQAYNGFIDSLSSYYNRTANVLKPPEFDSPPVYGKLGLSLTDYMGPGVLTSITFGISIGLTAVALIVERNEGLIDRTWVAGVSVSEIIISQVVTQVFILLVQITLLLTVVLFGFKIYNTYLSNIWLIGALAMMQGLTGMAFGLVLSATFTTESSALQGAIASFYPAILLSGVIWPLEGMPVFLRYISYCLPTTTPAESMRAIMGRGWGLAHQDVWLGFVVTTIWFLLFLFVAGLALKLRK